MSLNLLKQSSVKWTQSLHTKLWVQLTKPTFLPEEIQKFLSLSKCKYTIGSFHTRNGEKQQFIVSQGNVENAWKIQENELWESNKMSETWKNDKIKLKS